jgi:hypothetical protein
MTRHTIRSIGIIAGIYLGPTLVYAIAITILQLSTVCDGQLYSYYDGEIGRTVAEGKRFGVGVYGGFYFAASLVFIYVACLLGFSYSIITIRRNATGRDLAVFIIAASLCSCFGIALLLFLPTITNLCVIELYFSIPIKLITRLQDVALQGGQVFRPSFLVYAFLIGVFISNLAWWFVAAAGAVTLVPAEESEMNEQYDLAVRLSRVRLVMYAAALVLISNTICLSAWLRWPSSYTQDQELQTQLSGYGSTLSFYYGTTMTVILAVVFIPILYVFGEKAFALAKKQSSLETYAAQTQWLQAQGLSVDVQARLRDLATILGPMFAGSLTDLLDTFT